MFEHRLGLALGKSIAEIQAMSAEEFKSWQLFEMLEPFGWPDREYRTAALMSFWYNMNRGKKRAKKPIDFMRNMEKLVMNYFRSLQQQKEIEELPAEERRKLIAAQARKDFGI